MTRIINIHPLLFFLEGYLKGLPIPKDAPRIEKENQTLALGCVKILRAMYSEKSPVIGGGCNTPAMGRGEVTRILPGQCLTPTMGRGEGRRIQESILKACMTPTMGRGRAK
jgi:hypothetical protein